MSHSMMVSANPVSSLLTQNLGTATKKLTSAAGTSSPTTGSGTSTTSGTDSIGSTFLSLLVQELQNQDPTAPMDSTQMVGQMISLNQLNELTSINGTLSKAYPGTSSTSSSGAGASGGASGDTSGGASKQAVTSSATAAATTAAMHLLANNGMTMHPGVSPSVTLPAF